MIERRSLLAGMVAALCAPAVVRAASLMPVRRPPIGLAWGDVSAAARLYVDVGLVDDATGLNLVRVAGAPGPGQYAFDEVYAMYTFNQLDAGRSMSGYVTAPVVVRYADGQVDSTINQIAMRVAFNSGGTRELFRG